MIFDEPKEKTEALKLTNNSRKEINSKKQIFYLSLALLIIIIIVGSFFFWPRCWEVKSLDTSIIIKQGARKSIGLNTNKDSLNFGEVSPGALVVRSTKIKNQKEAKVMVITNGNFTNWLVVEPEKMWLNSNEEKEIFFTVDVPLNARPGFYNGKVYFCFK